MIWDILYLFLLFLIYSFIGWVIETITVYVKTKKWVNRGFLMGPYCPIYGMGSLILLRIFEEYKSDPNALYIIFVFYASVLEYFTSYLMEKMFNARWWDYSKNKFNINGRVCLENAAAFGLLGLCLGYYVHPFTMNILNYIPHDLLYLISLILVVVFIVDLSITFNIVTKLRKNIVLLNKDMTEDINKQIIKFIENNRIVNAFPLLKQTVNRIVGK